MENLRLLNSSTHPTRDAMAVIKDAFKEDIQQRYLIVPLAETGKVFHQFKLVVGSLAIRHESDNKAIRGIKMMCPCASHFTRSAGLKSKPDKSM
jgi:hypothetical protein